jgi:hypothetical protein
MFNLFESKTNLTIVINFQGKILLNRWYVAVRSAMFQQKTRSCLMWRTPCLLQVKITTVFRDSLLQVQQLSILVQHDLYTLW